MVVDGECEDTSDSWTNGDRETCSDYDQYWYCTADGDTGPGWNPEWGDMATFPSSDPAEPGTAVEVCCVCGGGHRTGTRPPLPPTTPPSPANVLNMYCMRVATRTTVLVDVQPALCSDLAAHDPSFCEAASDNTIRAMCSRTCCTLHPNPPTVAPTCSALPADVVDTLRGDFCQGYVTRGLCSRQTVLDVCRRSCGGCDDDGQGTRAGHVTTPAPMASQGLQTTTAPRMTTQEIRTAPGDVYLDSSSSNGDDSGTSTSVYVAIALISCLIVVMIGVECRRNAKNAKASPRKILAPHKLKPKPKPKPKPKRDSYDGYNDALSDVTSDQGKLSHGPRGHLVEDDWEALPSVVSPVSPLAWRPYAASPHGSVRSSNSPRPVFLPQHEYVSPPVDLHRHTDIDLYSHVEPSVVDTQLGSPDHSYFQQQQAQLTALSRQVQSLFGSGAQISQTHTEGFSGHRVPPDYASIEARARSDGRHDETFIHQSQHMKVQPMHGQHQQQYPRVQHGITDWRVAAHSSAPEYLAVASSPGPPQSHRDHRLPLPTPSMSSTSTGYYPTPQSTKTKTTQLVQSPDPCRRPVLARSVASSSSASTMSEVDPSWPGRSQSPLTMNAHLTAQVRLQELRDRTRDREVNFQHRHHTLESTTDGDDDQEGWGAHVAQRDARMATILTAHGRAQSDNQSAQGPNMIGQRRLSSPLTNPAASDDHQNYSAGIADAGMYRQSEFQEPRFVVAAAGARQAKEVMARLRHDAAVPSDHDTRSIALGSELDALTDPKNNMHSPTSPMYDNRNSFKPGYTAVGGTELSPTVAPYGEDF